jgi:hypothetical protein
MTAPGATAAALEGGAAHGFKLGIVTQQLGHDWDIETII